MLEIIRKRVSRDKTLGYSHNESNPTAPAHPASRPESAGVMLMEPDLTNPTNADEYYIWQPKGHPVSASIRFDFVDKLLVEIMKGFGSIPRRGAEVGGLLLGKSETKDGELRVRIEDFYPVSCEHIAGPSFQLSEKDLQDLAAGIDHFRNSSDPEALSVIGQYRSHTRDGLAISDDDIDLMDAHLPGDGDIMLRVKPFMNCLLVECSAQPTRTYCGFGGVAEMVLKCAAPSERTTG